MTNAPDPYDCDPGYLVMAFLDHAKALQYALCSTIGAMTGTIAPHWLAEASGLDIELHEDDGQSRPEVTSAQHIAINNLVVIYSAALNSHFGRESDARPIREELTLPFARHSTGIGGQRAGDFLFGLYDLPSVANFIISSTFVRLLGAWEQLQVDVIRCLLFYRPHGLLGPMEDNALITIDEEKAGKDLGFENQNKNEGAWNYLKTPAENRVERDKMFKKLYEIQMRSGEARKQDEAWYEARNNIAHGRGGSNITFAEYINADAVLMQSALFLGQECKDKQLIWL